MDDSINYLMGDKGVCRTAQDKPVLLNTRIFNCGHPLVLKDDIFNARVVSFFIIWFNPPNGLNKYLY